MAWLGGSWNLEIAAQVASQQSCSLVSKTQKSCHNRVAHGQILEIMNDNVHPRM